jgi:multiple sugar transport system ATP-binding protein
MLNLTKYFGKVVAVKDLDLVAEDRQFLTLLGPSGCGKSTTLNMIAGLETPTKGEIYLDDILINKVPPAHRNVAMVFQTYALYPHMNVWNNMAFALKIHKQPRQVIEKKVREAATMLGIADLLDRKPRELSGGQRQRVALGRAIVRDPKVFLLDEPLSNLDAALRLQMRAELKLLFDRLQATVIYVTHDQAEAMTMSDKVAILKDGVLQQVGSPLEIYYRPVNRFVAGFVGSPKMNFVTCTLKAEGETVFIQTADFKLSLAGSRSASRLASRIGQELALGIRPEDLHLDARENAITINGRAAVVEHLGSDTIILLDTGSQMLTLVAQGSAVVRSGENLSVRVDVDRVYLFEEDSERAVLTPELPSS